MRVESLKHEFVKFVPERLVEGILYVSLEHATTIHLCCCGCGREVVTPLSPAQWSLTFDGETVSLHPSIGNWSFPCQSHYWITRGQVRWARRWSADRIGEAREIDRRAVLHHSDGQRENESGRPPGRSRRK